MMLATAFDNDHWADALAGVGLGEDALSPAPDLGLFFASPLYPDLQTLIELVHRRSAASVLVGCTGHGVIGASKEIEGRPCMSMLNLMLPGTELFPKHMENQDFASLRSAESWRTLLGVSPDRINAWLVIADPYTFDTELFIKGLQQAYPGKPVAGGLASGLPYRARTWLFLGDSVYRSGAVVVGIGGAYTLRSVVAQGTVPIGRPWTITSVEHNTVLTVENRPAYDVLAETLDTLSDEMRDLAIKGVQVGLAPEPSADQGEFLVRSLTGSNARNGSVTLNAAASVGQALQFQVRHPEAADANLRQQLQQAREELSGVEIAGALLCSARRRGVGLFGIDGHDSQLVTEVFGQIPLGGFLCDGEIATVGSRPLLHGATAGLAFFVSKGPRRAEAFQPLWSARHSG